MKKIASYALGILYLVNIIACSSSKESNGIWVNKEKKRDSPYKSMFIIALTADAQVRAQVESDLATEAAYKGFKVVKSIDVLPPDLKNPALPTKEAILEKVTSTGCEAIFTSVLLQKHEAARYTPGKTTYAPTNYYTWTGTFTGYYTNWQPRINTTTYYEQDKQYFIESNLYDAENQTLMFSIQSKVFNPSSLGNFSMVYSKGLVMKMEDNGLLKK